ncbi:hypothetical protein [Nocardioides sp.]|uniref:hypothetical protein n=1 Tax=Nocardioides sp. TaxID=35761 RepID=UPI0025D4E616|nr:hypothetical protein [Nocardioides sp.]
MRLRRSHDSSPRRISDEGSALIITMMVMVLLTALATTAAALTINNLQSSWRAQQAGSALNAADAGISQALTYLRSNGVRSLACSPTCTTNSWGSSTNPTTETLPGAAGESYRAWIKPLAAFPANDPGRYRIFSTGTATGAAAARTVSVDVTITKADLPRGIFARTISGGGSASVRHESVFSSGCVSNRKQIAMDPDDIDLAYGIPVGVHSARYITEKNNADEYCTVDNKAIHRTNACNPTYPNDQDLLGGPLGTGCGGLATKYPGFYGAVDVDGDGGLDVNGSWIKDEQSLLRLFKLKNPPLSQAQIDQLRATAKAQKNHWTSASGWTVPTQDNAVMFFDLTGLSDHADHTIDLNPLDASRFDPATWTGPGGCPVVPTSLVIVVEAGNVKFNANLGLSASMFLTGRTPYGQVLRANGTADFLGTIYADSVNLVGNVDFSLSQCFLDNLSPSLLDVRVDSYLEDDRG